VAKVEISEDVENLESDGENTDMSSDENESGGEE
jgi:hypothetical protein